MASSRDGDGTFRDDVVEKVWRLSRVLDALSLHPALAGNLALHGGTALAKGELDTSMLFAGHPELSERASRNPVALHKRNNIRSAIRRGLMTT